MGARNSGVCQGGGSDSLPGWQYGQVVPAGATSDRHRLVLSRMAIWVLGSVVGVVVVALPDDNARIFSLSRTHGPSVVDGLGVAILIASWAPIATLLWSSRSTLRCAPGLGVAMLAVVGTILLAVTISRDTGAEWLLAVGLLVVAQLVAIGLAWRGGQS